MKDNGEGGSVRAGSAHHKPAASPTMTASGSDPGLLGQGVERPVSADMQQFIGRQLRAVFDDVAKQPIPDRFLELMKQLDNKTGAR